MKPYLDNKAIQYHSDYIELNRSIIRNFKNSKPLEPSKHKKHDQIWSRITTLPLNNHEKTSKKEGKRKEGNLPKPLPSFSFYRPYNPPPFTKN